MQGQQPILRVLPAPQRDEAAEERVADFLEDLVELGHKHLSLLNPDDPRSAPWHQALGELQRHAATSLGRRRVRLASSG